MAFEKQMGQTYLNESSDSPTNLAIHHDAERGAQDEVKGEDTSDLKLDTHGLPLVPQPTSNKDDPLVG